VVSDAQDAAPDSIGLLVTAKEAVNETVIDIEQKYPSAPVEPKTEEKHKTSFWHNIFH